jgi:phosphate transport system substrate-binding protein
LQHLCDGTGAYDFPDMVQLNRRLTAEEYRTCTSNGPSAIVEQKLGYQAVLLARGKPLGPLRLTARDVFLALAKYVPDPQRSGELIANPYTNWKEVDPELPLGRIEFQGPNILYFLDKLPAYLLLSAGCNTYPWIAALRDTDEGRYREICQTVRTDGVYQEAYLDGGWGQENLARRPSAIGIFPGTATLGESLVVIPVDGVVPNKNTLASGNYPLAITLYLYLDKIRIDAGVNNLLLSMVSKNAFDRRSTTYWGFVPVDLAEQQAKELHF